MSARQYSALFCHSELRVDGYRVSQSARGHLKMIHPYKWPLLDGTSGVLVHGSRKAPVELIWLIAYGRVFSSYSPPKGEE